MLRKIPPIVIRIFLNMYVIPTISWDGKSNPVKFCVYFDGLLHVLTQNKYDVLLVSLLLSK